MKPAKDEHSAPTTTAIADSVDKNNCAKITRTTINTSKYLYSVFMNANAPLWIWSPIFLTLSSPSGYFITNWYTTKATTIPTTPKIGAINKLFIFTSK